MDTNEKPSSLPEGKDQERVSMAEPDEPLLEHYRDGSEAKVDGKKGIVPVLDDNDLRRFASRRQVGHAPKPLITKGALFMMLSAIILSCSVWHIWIRDKPSGQPLRLDEYPIPEYSSIRAKLQEYRVNHRMANGAASQEILDIIDEYMTCLYAIMAEVQTPEVSPFIRDANLIAGYISNGDEKLNKMCRSQYHVGTRKLLKTVYENCPSFKYGEQRLHGQTVYDMKLRDLLPWAWGEDSSLTYLFGPNGVIENYEAWCNKDDPGLGTDVCRDPFRVWGIQNRHQTWGGQGFDLKDLIRKIRQPLPDAFPALPSRVNDRIAQNCQGKLVPRQDQLNSLWEKASWEWWRRRRGPGDNWRTKEILKEGVCSGCVWRRFVWREGVGEVNMVKEGTKNEEAMEWIRTVHLIRDTCLLRGKRLEPNNLTRVDEKWISLYGQDLFNEAFKEGRDNPPWLGEDSLGNWKESYFQWALGMAERSLKRGIGSLKCGFRFG